MPTLKELYESSIQTVREDPQKIGAHFWLALTAYKMMQDDPDDNSYDHSYANVGSKHFELMNSPAYAKALKIVGEDQTLELMQHPERFWNVFGALEENPDRETVADLKVAEKEAYQTRVNEIKSSIKSRPRQQAALQKAAEDYAKRSAALFVANEKNGGIGVVSPAELNDTLAELSQDPYFGLKASLQSTRFLEEVIDDPSTFIEEYRTEKEIFEELSQIRDKKDYKGLIDRCEELLEKEDDPKLDMYTNAIRACLEQKIPNLGANKEFDDETKEFIIGFTNELTRRTAENSLAVRLAKNEMKQRARNGEFRETMLVNDDPKLLDKIGEDLAMYQTDAGQKMSVYSTLVDDIFYRCTVNANGSPKGTVNGTEARQYVSNTLENTVKETYQKNHPEFLEGMDKYPDGGPKAFLKDQWFYQPRKNRDGFVYKKTRAKEGESFFEGMPELHKKLLDMTPEQLLAYEHEQAKKRAIDAEIPEKFKDFNKKADYLVAEMDAEKDEVKQTEAYKKMYAELKNFQNFGTPEFVTSGTLGTKGVSKNAHIAKPLVKKAILRLDLAAKAYEKFDPEFAKKVKGFVWEQKTANKKYLENEILDDKEFKLIGKVKQIKAEELQGAGFDVYADADTRQQGIGGKDGKIAQLRKKYKDAKLVFGKKEYDRVGEVLGYLEKAFKTLEDTEKHRTEKNKQDDMRSNQTLLTEVENVKDYVDSLKFATGKYFEHKKKDGQWIGSNKNANKRIAAIKEIDEFADMLGDILSAKSKVLRDKILAAQPKPVNAPAEQPKQPKQPSPEELFKQSKESFADEAAEVWLKNKFKSTIDEQIDQKHPDYNEQQRQQVHEQNAGKADAYIAENKEALKNDEAFKSFMENIKNKNDLEDMKQYAQADNGSKLYRIINGEKVIENEPADLDKKIKRAQESLAESKGKLKANEFPNPGHGNNYNDYATIVTAYYVKAHKQELGENITNEVFDSLKKEIKSKMVMKNVIKLNKPETLYSKATTDKGQNIWSEYSNKLTKYNEQKKIIEDNKKALESKTLNNGDPTVKPKVLN